jgi:hypothetical protein
VAFQVHNKKNHNDDEIKLSARVAVGNNEPSNNNDASGSSEKTK